VRVHEELTIEVCDDEGDEHEVTVLVSGLFTRATMHDPGEMPTVEVLGPRGIAPELYEEIERVASETWLEAHYRGEDR